MSSSQQAEPQGQNYLFRIDLASNYANGNIEAWPSRGRSIPAEPQGSWNDRYLAGLFRNGLRLTTQSAWLLMYDDRYPDGIPMKAPRPTTDEPNVWPPETWIIFRD